MVAINYSVLFTIQTVLFGGPGANVETDTGISSLANPGTYAVGIIDLTSYTSFS